MKIINPEYTVEKIVQRMKDAAARAVYGGEKSVSSQFDQIENGGGNSRFNAGLDIHPITLQPEFHPHSDDRYHVNDLLKFNDSQFVQNAYQAILKRPADEDGYSGLLEGLRSGSLNKLDVLAKLRFSSEGRSKGVQIEGLGFPATLRKVYRLPVIGYFVNLFVALARLPAMVRSHRQFEAHILAQQETLVRQINHVGNSLLAHAQQMAHAVGASNEHLRERLERFIEEQSSTQEVFRARFAELTNYFEERLNDEAAERQAELLTIGKQLGEATSEWRQLNSYYDQALSAERERLRSLEKDLTDHSRRNTADLVLYGQRMSRFLDNVANQLSASGDDRLEVVQQEQAHALDGFYASFDEQFRGQRDEIKERLKVYLPFIEREDSEPIIDVGCGRGEWLELVSASGRRATGVEKNSVLVEQCRELGLEAVEADLVEYLKSLPDESVGGVTGFHIAEHLPIEVLISFLNETMRVLKDGGVLILETPNPRNVLVGTCNFYFDPTHRNPIPSEVLEFLVASRGFSRVEILPLNPSDEMPVAGESELVDRFNKYFYGPMDYGVVAWKPGKTLTSDENSFAQNVR